MTCVDPRYSAYDNDYGNGGDGGGGVDLAKVFECGSQSRIFCGLSFIAKGLNGGN